MHWSTGVVSNAIVERRAGLGVLVAIELVVPLGLFLSTLIIAQPRRRITCAATKTVRWERLREGFPGQLVGFD